MTLVLEPRVKQPLLLAYLSCTYRAESNGNLVVTRMVSISNDSHKLWTESNLELMLVRVLEREILPNHLTT